MILVRPTTKNEKLGTPISTLFIVLPDCSRQKTRTICNPITWLRRIVLILIFFVFCYFSYIATMTRFDIMLSARPTWVSEIMRDTYFLFYFNYYFESFTLRDRISRTYIQAHSSSYKRFLQHGNRLPEHVFPSPVNPALQAHAYDPTVLLHIALTSQLRELVEHSSISASEL